MPKVSSSTAALSFLENGADKSHADEIVRHLTVAKQAICIVAFAKSSGWRLIEKALADRSARGLKATFVIGLNFYQSEPAVLRAILRLRPKAVAAGGEIKLYTGQERSRRTLHPKVYWFKGTPGDAVIIGSANMTSGGLTSNHEISASAAGSAASQQAWLESWICDRLKAGDIVEATPTLIADYEKRRNVYQATMQIAERRASRAMASAAGDAITLADLLIEMRADKGHAGFDHATKQRRKNLPAARAQLAMLAREPDLKRSAFLKGYEKLIGRFHSSGLDRAKTTIAQQSHRFQVAVRALRADPSQDPAVLFDLLKTHFNRIPRAGTNVLTEILHARNPALFPVMNQNSVAGMGLANVTGYPRKPVKTLVDGVLYARFAAHAEALRQTLKLRDLSELDALFNYAYQKEGGDEG